MESETAITKRLILKIIQAYGGKLDGKIRLFKTYYYAHLEYFKVTGRTLTDGTIVHMEHGPGIDEHLGVLNALEKDGLIRQGSTQLGGYTEFNYTLTTQVDLGDSHEDEAIRRAVRTTQPFTGKQLSDMTHVTSHSWNRTTDGQFMDICVDAVDVAALAEIKKRLEAARKVSKAFNA